MESEQPFESRLNLDELRTAVDKIRAEASKVIIGQTDMIDLLIAATLARGHVLIEGVPGIAKTMTARILTKCFSSGFSRVQFTPDLMPSDVIGTSIFNPKTLEFQFVNGPIFSNFVLIDEINRSPAKTQSALFEVMEERQITIDGKTYPMEQPFMVLATQNPIEHEGTYRLPEAELDRFLFKIFVNYPGVEDEATILSTFHERGNVNPLDSIGAVITEKELLGYIDTVSQVQVDGQLFGYIARLVTATRNHPSLYLGASPRASLAIMNAGKAIAAMDGRDFITPEDVQFVARPVMRHRLLLTPEKEMEGTTPDDVIRQIIESTEVPR
ncbi:MAG: MoxR family ATPase [Rhodothermaceae bacterium]|nr:MoxR family ATPase [Rhodothermaceae bacterium]